MGYAFAYTIFWIRDKKREPTVTAYSLKKEVSIQSMKNFDFIYLDFF